MIHSALDARTSAHSGVRRTVLPRKLLALMLLLASGSWFPATATALADPLADFHALEDQVAEAHEAYMDALRDLEEKNEGRPVDPAKLPPDPRRPILKKMDALADATLGKPGGVQVAAGAFGWSWTLDLDLDGLLGRFRRLVQHYPDEPELDDVLGAVGNGASDVGSPDDLVKILHQLIAVTKRDRTKVNAWFAVGRVQLAAKKLAESKTAFENVLKMAPEPDLADAAKGYLFEIEHLQPGMEAPDFATRTLDGKEVTLRSLRGKVILLNFWASW